MTGGWKPYRDEDLPKRYGDVRPVVLGANELLVDELLEGWRRGLRFRRIARRVLGKVGLKFAEWQVLRGTARLVRVRDDVVSQQEVARYCILGEGVVSEAMTRLMDIGLLDVGPDAWGWSYRVLVTKKGQGLLARLEARIATAALRLQVDDGGAAEGFDGDFGEELGGGEDAEVGEVGFEELADVAADVGLREDDDGADIGGVTRDGAADGGDDVAGGDGGEGQEAAGRGAGDGAAHAFFDVGVEQEGG